MTAKKTKLARNAPQPPTPKPAQGRDGRFLSGNCGGGRPVGARNKLSEAFLEALATDFEQHGAEVIGMVRGSEPAAYLRVIASVMPRKIEAEPATDVTLLTDAQLDALIRDSLAEQGKEIPALDDTDTQSRPSPRSGISKSART